MATVQITLGALHKLALGLVMNNAVGVHALLYDLEEIAFNEQMITVTDQHALRWWFSQIDKVKQLFISILVFNFIDSYI